MSSSATLFSPAKINLFLHLVAQRPDGYHKLQTAFALLNWGDTITLSISPPNVSSNGLLQLTDLKKLVGIVGMDDVPLASNLMFKAIHAYQTATQIPLGKIHIQVNKRIPMGAGLGGGSSNAASILLALNQEFNALKHQQLLRLGANLGADVPVFINAQHAWAEGIGDELFPLHLDKIHVLLALPKVHVNTQKAFQNPELPRFHLPLPRPPVVTNVTCLRLNDISHNHFEPSIRQAYPEINACFKHLNAIGTPRLSGSGASVFVPFETEIELKQGVSKLQKLHTAGLPFEVVEAATL